MGKDKKSKEAKDPLEAWFERDLTEEARSGSYGSIVGLAGPLARARELMAGGRHPIFIGEPGVGKTACVKELVRSSLEDSTSPLHGKRVFQLSIRRCASTIKQGETLGSPMIALFKWLEKNPEVVPYFRDFPMAWRFDLEPHFESLGYHLKRPVLCEGEPQLVGRILEYEPELEKHYATVPVREPSLKQVAEIVRSWAGTREEVHFDEAALETAIQLSHRFLPRSRMPRKVLDPLANLEAAARGAAHGRSIRVDDVVEFFCRTCGVPRTLVDPKVRLDLDAFEEELRSSVLGQEEAITAMMQMVSRIKADLIDPRRSFGVFLFVGPTGVGKTHLARRLADKLLGSEERMLRLNMADYPEDHHALTVFGNPEDDRPAMRRGVLTERILGSPFAVLLLDEFEKANKKLHDRFLQLFDEGSFINGAGTTISCRSLVIIATSNAGAELWREERLGFASRAHSGTDPRDLEQSLREHFRFEFLNRFDQVVHFRPLGRPEIRSLAVRELGALESRAGLRLRGLRLEVDEAVLDWLTVHGYDPYFGARFLHRTIERSVSSGLSELLVRGAPAKAVGIALTIRKGGVRSSWIEEEAQTEPKTPVEISSGPTPAEHARWSRSELETEVSRLSEQAATRLAALDEERVEYSAVLEEMNDPAFWNDPSASREVLERFRELDVSIRIQRRLALPLERLVEISADITNTQTTGHLRQAFESASRALSEWDARHAESFARDVWIVLRAADPAGTLDGWVEELATMELLWCQRLQLDAEVVAYHIQDGEVRGAALEVRGPGAAGFLRMEEGLHRRIRKEGYDLRVRVDVVPRSSAPLAAITPRAAKKVPRRFDLSPEWSGAARVPALGLQEEWLGEDRETLTHFLGDWSQVMSQRSSMESPETVRVYGEGGTGARDPRTREAVARHKDVLRGQLDRLLKAWRKLQEPESVS